MYPEIPEKTWDAHISCNQPYAHTCCSSAAVLAMATETQLASSTPLVLLVDVTQERGALIVLAEWRDQWHVTVRKHGHYNQTHKYMQACIRAVFMENNKSENKWHHILLCKIPLNMTEQDFVFPNSFLIWRYWKYSLQQTDIDFWYI